MSGIFGLIHLDNSPITEQELQAMRSAMQEWGPDGGSTWRDAAAGLGSLIRFNTPEARTEHLPLRSEQGFVLTAAARLDNRVDLFRELDIAGTATSTLPDGDLILRAYERWGDQAPAHLLGDWSFAAWYPQERKLFLARDHFGNTSLYYYQDPHRFAFASSRKALLALGIPRRLNEFFLACLLVSWPAHHGPQTIELDIQRLPPAHTLTLTGSTVRTRQYWRLEDTAELHLKDQREYVDGFLAIYDQAVRDRLRSERDLGVTLSGGMDSGSVTSLVARALREQNRRLRAYTSVPTHDVSHMASDQRFADERAFAQSTASFAGNVDLIEIRADALTPVQAMRRALEIHAEPGHAAGNVYWILDLLARARRDGIGTLLSGQGGNATISWTGQDRGRRIRRYLQTGQWFRILQLLIYPGLPLPLIRGVRAALHRGELDWSGTAIHPDFARRIGLASRYIQRSGETSNPEDWLSPQQQRYAIIKPGESFLGSIWAESGAAYQIEVRDPTFDKRVMEYTLSIPDRMFSGPDGYDRWIIRGAMQGIMPDDVRLNRRRGRQAGDLGQHLLESSPEVEAALNEVEGSQMAREYLALARMRDVWQSIRGGVNERNTNQAVTILTRGMMAGLYLVGIDKAS